MLHYGDNFNEKIMQCSIWTCIQNADLCGMVKLSTVWKKIFLFVAVLKNLINLSTADTATQKSEWLQVLDSWSQSGILNMCLEMHDNIQEFCTGMTDLAQKRRRLRLLWSGCRKKVKYFSSLKQQYTPIFRQINPSLYASGVLFHNTAF